MKRYLMFSAAMLIASLAWADVSVTDERVSIEVSQVSLTAVLTDVAHQAGASIKVDPKVERSVTISMKNLPLQRAMDQVARQESLNIVLGWRRDAAGVDHLASIDVLPDGNMDPAALEKEDHRRARMSAQQEKTRPGRAIPGGAEDKSGWGNPLRGGGKGNKDTQQ